MPLLYWNKKNKNMEIKGLEEFKNEQRDCTVRALCHFANIDYKTAHDLLKKYGRKDKHGVRINKIFQKVCKELNINAKCVKRSKSVYKVIKQFPKGRLYCLKRGHAFTIIDGIISDETSIHSHIKEAWLLSQD